MLSQLWVTVPKRILLGMVPEHLPGAPGSVSAISPQEPAVPQWQAQRAKAHTARHEHEGRNPISQLSGGMRLPVHEHRPAAMRIRQPNKNPRSVKTEGIVYEFVFDLVLPDNVLPDNALTG
ncbi:MAG: hypothetical protein ACYTHJ_07720 [Planctomycetota bacterium]|jgi:hypothetical protein